MRLGSLRTEFIGTIDNRKKAKIYSSQYGGVSEHQLTSKIFQGEIIELLQEVKVSLHIFKYASITSVDVAETSVPANLYVVIPFL